MDMLKKILTDVPQTWENREPHQYTDDSKYHLVELQDNNNLFSTSEYARIKMEFPSHVSIRYIKRVEDPFQLGLFKIMKAKRQAEGQFCTIVSKNSQKL